MKLGVLEQELRVVWLRVLYQINKLGVRATLEGVLARRHIIKSDTTGPYIIQAALEMLANASFR